MDDEKKCPFCAEMIKSEAIICKHCHSELKSSPKEKAKEAKTKKENLTLGNIVLTFISGIFMLLLGGCGLAVLGSLFH